MSGCDPTQSGVAAGVQSTQCWNVAPSPNYWNWGTLNPLTLGFDTSSYSHWSSGEPNNFGDVESAAINLANKGGWNDVDPTKPYYGIIEIHSSPDVTDGSSVGLGHWEHKHAVLTHVTTPLHSMDSMVLVTINFLLVLPVFPHALRVIL